MNICVQLFIVQHRFSCEHNFQLRFYNLLRLSSLYFSFLALLALCCRMGFSVVAVSRGYSLVAMCRLLIVLAFLVAKHRVQVTWASGVIARGLSSCSSRAVDHKLNSCGTRAQLLHGMWDLPGPEIEPMFPELAVGFFISEPPGKPLPIFKNCFIHLWERVRVG